MIPFNKPFISGKEIEYINKVFGAGHISGDGSFTRRCSEWLENNLNCKKALLTHSCTASLEMSAILSGIKEGDEVIMPSYTFVSTANAFVLRGAIPRFVDIREDTLNIDEQLIESSINSKTKAIVPVHYAGNACEMDTILEVAKRHNILVIEDAAQAIMSEYKGQRLGTIGDLGCLSFHETKNVICGEGGALLVNSVELAERAEIIREKGTNRKKFQLGLVDKYSWVDVGSSYLPGEMAAAFLLAQLEEIDYIGKARKKIWTYYHNELKDLEDQGYLQRPTLGAGLGSNAHMYYIILTSMNMRDQFISSMKSQGITCVFHYVPLHASEFCKAKYNDYWQSLPITESISKRLVRLPFWIGLNQDQVIHHIKEFFIEH